VVWVSTRSWSFLTRPSDLRHDTSMDDGDELQVDELPTHAAPRTSSSGLRRERRKATSPSPPAPAHRPASAAWASAEGPPAAPGACRFLSASSTVVHLWALAHER
jgi:hypothetical protein